MVERSMFSKCCIPRLHIVDDNLEKFAEAIEKFGVGNAAVNLMYAAKTDFPRTFLVEKIHGEDPLEEIVIKAPGQELHSDKNELKRKLSYEGVAPNFEPIIKNGEVHAEEFVRWLEARPLSRAKTVEVLNYIGFEMDSIRETFRSMKGGEDEG